MLRDLWFAHGFESQGEFQKKHDLGIHQSLSLDLIHFGFFRPSVSGMVSLTQMDPGSRLKSFTPSPKP